MADCLKSAEAKAKYRSAKKKVLTTPAKHELKGEKTLPAREKVLKNENQGRGRRESEESSVIFGTAEDSCSSSVVVAWAITGALGSPTAAIQSASSPAVR
jgi:hypothetical protein